MDYATLCTNIQSICENQFSDSELAMFVQQAEQKIYNSVQLPATRETMSVPISAGETRVASPFLWGKSALYFFGVNTVDALGNTSYLINKEWSFIKEAYPNQTQPSTWGQPKYYAIGEADITYGPDQFWLYVAPTPAVDMSILLDYSRAPDSIVTAGTTWLGDNFDSALLNGSLVEALRFMKGEADMVALYDKLFVDSMQLLKQLVDGKLKQDSYRSGQARVKVL